MKRLLLLAVAFISLFVAMGFASTACSFVSTGDGGWVWQNPLPQGNAMTDIDFADANDGWAVGGWTPRASFPGHPGA